MLDFKKSGSRLINSKNHIARIVHQCWNEFPDCCDHQIFPGDLYERQVWVNWFFSENGKLHESLQVKKYHISPGCVPDPESFESEQLYVSGHCQLPLAA